MIAQNLKNLREKISRKCAEINRNPSEIKLIAVSKNFGTDEIQTAMSEGQQDFGENRAQELVSKYEVLGNSVIWHFIGNLQRNKVRFAVSSADYIHSVSSLLIATEIERLAGKAGKKPKVLLQVKTSSEDTKSGISDESELWDLAGYCKEFKNMELVGLMTMAPLTEDKELIRNSFSYLKNLRDDLNSEGFYLKELSMGMTDDYEIAIEEGATMLRIGSAIFGTRYNSNNPDEE
jgi:PLP dependent protein